MAEFGTSTTVEKPRSDLRQYVENTRQSQASLKDRLFEQKVRCHHHSADGLNIELKPYADYLQEKGGKGMVRIMEGKYDPDTTFICAGPDGCGAIFDMRPYSDEEVEQALYVVFSVINQIKALSRSIDIADEGMEELESMDATEPSFKAVARLYSKVKESMEDNKSKNQNQQRQKGKYGGAHSNGGGIHMY